MPRKKEVSEETWDKLRLEYISSSDVSMRGLQKKYGIPFNAIKNRVDSEGWKDQREEFKSKSMQKSIDLLADHNAEECSRAFRLASKVMTKLEEAVDSIDTHDDYAIKNLKEITSAIKNLKEIGVFRSQLDRMEQEARINKLRKDAADDTSTNDVKVIIEDDDGFSE